MLKYFLDKYKSEEMCKEAVDACLPLLKFIHDRFVKKKVLKDLDNAVFFNDTLVFVNADSDDVTLFSDDMGLVNVDLNNISLGDDNLPSADPESIIHIRFMAWCSKYKHCKTCKKEISKKLMLVAWNPKRWDNWCMPEDKKKEIKPFLADEK